MMAKQFYDWQTAGGTNDVMRLVDCLERADIPWCAIGGVAVDYWAAEPVVTEDVHFVVAADVHGILLRVTCLEDTLRGKIKAWSDTDRRQSKRIKDLADIARLVEAHPPLWDALTDDLRQQLRPPGKK